MAQWRCVGANARRHGLVAVCVCMAFFAGGVWVFVVREWSVVRGFKLADKSQLGSESHPNSHSNPEGRVVEESAPRLAGSVR